MERTFEKRKKVVYGLMKEPLYTPMKLKDLAVFLQVPKERRDDLRLVLEALEQEGKIHLSKRGKYCLGDEGRLTGRFRANQRGFGFVEPEEKPGQGTGGDIYIREEDTGTAMDGDLVEVAVLTRGPEQRKNQKGAGQARRAQEQEAGERERKREGKIVHIIERGTAAAVGLFEIHPGKNYGFVIPDNRKLMHDIYIPAEKAKGAVSGQKVVAEITFYGDGRRKPEGRIVEILGPAGDPGVDILSIVRSYQLPEAFSDKTLNQAERVAKPVSAADCQGRLDLRGWRMVTIDGEDAKDLDDAVSVRKDGENYILGVHIADVANYVQENSALDHEALKRGTSVYLADRVIPMLPRCLSNGICSLNAGEDRLALSCIMTVNPKGTVISHEVAETVIRVDERMTYSGVSRILEGQDALACARYEKLAPMFRLMQELSLILQKRRQDRGAIGFDLPEAKILLDENGKPVDIRPYERDTAAHIIEEFMLLANETVAEDYFWREIPFLYRTHEPPEEKKIRALAVFVNNFGYRLHIGANEVHPKEVQKLLRKVEGSPEEALIGRVALRSMKQARYTTENTGHFGLAAKYYTHFTSPIRRYPDLQIHRIIKDNLRGRMKKDKIRHYACILPEVAEHTSETERRADEAERETVKLEKAEYMRQYIGETYEGVISGMTNWGMYVELPNTVEGLVHVTRMTDDHYDYIEDRWELAGEHTRKSYRLGQKVKVRVVGVDLLMHTIDFELA